MRTMTMAGLMLAMLAGTAGDVHAGGVRKAVRCCVQVPASDQVVAHPWCFNVRARSRRVGRRICRAIGGRPPRALDA